MDQWSPLAAFGNATMSAKVRDHKRRSARPGAPRNATMSTKDATMSTKDATMSAKDATRSAKDATMSAKDATRSAKTRP